MPNLGIMAGGAAQSFGQSFNSARQKAIEEAYVKIAQQRETLMKSQMDYRAAENMAAHPETAEAMGSVYPEIEKYRSNPEGYSWAQPSTPAVPEQNIPMQGPPTPDMAAQGQYQLPDFNIPGQPQQDFPAQSGQEGYSSMLGYWGKRAREAAIEAEGRKFAHAMELMRLKPNVNPDVAEAMAAARSRGNAIGQSTVMPEIEGVASAKAAGAAKGALPFVGPKAQAAGVATGKVAPAGGTAEIPSPGGSVQVPVGNKMPSAAQIREASDLDAAVSFVDSLAKTAKTGAPGTETGKPQAWWTAHAGKWASTPVIGDMINKVDPYIANRAAFHEALGQNLLTTLRTVFKGRISNFDVVFGREVIPNATDSDQVRNGKLNELSARLHATREVIRQADAQGGVAAMAPINVPIPPGGLLGSTGPAGDVGPQQPPTGVLQMPQSPPYNLGVQPVPSPGNLKTLRREQ